MQTRGRRRRFWGLLAIAAALVAIAPASAQALTVSGTAAPTDTQAGAHSDFKIHMDFGGGEVKNLSIALPPGMIGDPTATPLCTVTQLNADSCPSSTVVGSVSAAATLLGIVPATVNGSLYNLEPQPGEPARFGIVLHALPLPPPLDDLLVPPIILQSAVQLRPTDFGLNTVIENIPNTTLGLPTTINSQDITLYGTAPGTGEPFMRNPTSCGTATTEFSATPYTGAAGTDTADFTPTGCGSVPFSPAFSANLDVPQRVGTSERPTLSTAIDQDDGEAGLANAKVFIPLDLGVDFDRLGSVCQPSEFAAGACPPASVLGDALATSPLLTQPLSGGVYLVATPAGLPDVGLDLHGQLNLQLRGTLGLDKTTVFDGLPDIPIAHFALTFNGGPGSLLLSTRDLCDPPTPVFHAEFTGHNGANTAVDSPSTVTCHGPLITGGTAGKCKAKSKKKRGKKTAVEAKKKKKKGCGKKKRKKRR